MCSLPKRFHKIEDNNMSYERVSRVLENAAEVLGLLRKVSEEEVPCVLNEVLEFQCLDVKPADILQWVPRNL